MRLWNSEFAHSYKNYSFGYCNYAIKEKKDFLADIYARGFLPYSGDVRAKNVFYMARSARVRLSDFELNSENRRIAKRFDGKFERESVYFDQFDSKDRKFEDFCLAYFRKRHGKEVMPRERLRAILDSGLITFITVYKEGEKLIGYVLEVADRDMAHFWFSFYGLGLVRQSLGMWLMIDALREAKQNGKKYYYLGTVYADKALYKTNFDALEYWDGREWVEDTKKLKSRSRSDSDRSIACNDEWKESL